ncbi:MAG TPA: hypothetical protein VHP33_05970 [Polyangiaceae bacterium]|nr:hypothetical protein [Polyangiaceae bacterium]
MARRSLGWLALGLGLPCLPGCGKDGDFEAAPPPFEKKSDVQVWATAASALGVYSNVHEFISVADGRYTYEDPTCPKVTDDGITLTIEGGCNDESGGPWTGRAVIERDGDDRAITLTDFNGDDGTFSLHWIEPSLREFEAHLVIGGVTTIDYAGSVQGDYDTPTSWNGSGHIVRDGFLPPNGAVDATTLNEVVDDAVCSGQPVSGSTALRSGDDVAVVKYDGETDCDTDQNAELTVNGEERGLVEGVNCAVSAPGNARNACVFGGFFGAALGLGLLRRRSRPTTWRAARPCAAPRARSARCRCRASSVPAPDL